MHLELPSGLIWSLQTQLISLWFVPIKKFQFVVVIEMTPKDMELTLLTFVCFQVS